MTRKGMVRSAALVACLAMAARHSSAACGPTAVCGDTSSTLQGQINSETIVLTWSTDDENSAVAFYRILRYTTDPSASTFVKDVTRVGSCSVNEDYQEDDQPPSPVSSWTYTVEVHKVDGLRACAIDVTPQ